MRTEPTRGRQGRSPKPVSSASSPVDTAGSIATTIRTKSGIFRWTGQRARLLDQRAGPKGTLDGKPLLELGQRGQHSDTGHIANWLAERAAGPFNHPTEMMAHPNGDIYVTDGYRNARVHRFTRDGGLVKSWGAPGKSEGQFHLPHSIAFDDDGKLYVADRSNKRIQIFTPEGD